MILCYGFEGNSLIPKIRQADSVRRDKNNVFWDTYVPWEFWYPRLFLAWEGQFQFEDKASKWGKSLTGCWPSFYTELSETVYCWLKRAKSAVYAFGTQAVCCSSKKVYKIF